MSVFTPAFIGGFAHYMSQLLLKTLRIQICWHPTISPQDQYAYGFWHDKQFLPIVLLSNSGNKQACLVSASGDGEMLAHWLKRVGYHVIRGSSSRKAISSLVNMLSLTKEGYSVGIAADGPRGPRHEAKSGLAFLAYKSGLPIIPVGVASSSKWQFNKSWDKYQLPRLFAKVVLYAGEPFVIADLSDIQAVNLQVAQAINASEQKAAQILQGKSLESLEAIATESTSS